MKIAYIDLAYHIKTKSNDFLKEYFEFHFDLDYYWIHSGEDEDLDYDLINAENYESIIFFQVILKPSKVTRFKCRNLIYIPMYDSVITKSNLGWLYYQLLGVRIISFSSFLHHKLSSLRFDIIYVKYFPELNVPTYHSDKLRVFFWQRSNEVNWSIIKTLIKKEDVEKFTLRKAFDLNDDFILPSETDQSDYNLKIVEGWLEKEEYLNLLKECNLFIAPRAAEGIGLSFLDAMSYNIPVLAPDAPTMNEYITHGINGYLYDIKMPKPIDFSSIRTIQTNLRKEMELGRKEWINSGNSIVAFIKNNKNNKTTFRSTFFQSLLIVKSLLIKLKQTIYK